MAPMGPGTYGSKTGRPKKKKAPKAMSTGPNTMKVSPNKMRTETLKLLAKKKKK
jgi:hypothetical protein